MVTKVEINTYFDFVYPLVVRASEMLQEGYKGQKKVAEKGEFDMVTDYDHRIEEFLIKEISTVYPIHKFIGEEESALKGVTKILTNEPTWMIDPIDGTANFVKQLPHICVSVALAIKKEIVLGIVINPIADETYTVKKGQGAYLNNQKISVSDCETIGAANIAYEISLLHLPKEGYKHLKRLFYVASRATRAMAYGSVILSLCYVARGSLDAYHISDMFPWDVAVGSLLITEAGGVVYNTTGGEFNVMQADLVCASKENLCREMINLISQADEAKELKLE